MILCLLFEGLPGDFEHVGRGLFPGLWILRLGIADMIFQKLSQEAVDRTVGCCEALEHVGALFIFMQAPQFAF